MISEQPMLFQCARIARIISICKGRSRTSKRVSSLGQTGFCKSPILVDFHEEPATFRPPPAGEFVPRCRDRSSITGDCGINEQQGGQHSTLIALLNAYVDSREYRLIRRGPPMPRCSVHNAPHFDWERHQDVPPVIGRSCLRHDSPLTHRKRECVAADGRATPLQ